MQCPVCSKSMMILEFQNVEMDFCPSCEGCWLDRGELGLILTGTLDAPGDWKLIGEQKSDRRCPRCTGKMKAGILPGTDVEVDVCLKHHGFWLDKGELQTVVKERGASASSSLTAFVASVFGGKANV
jgi:uncharacterized protein